MPINPYLRIQTTKSKRTHFIVTCVLCHNVAAMPRKFPTPESSRETEPPVVMASRVQLQGVYSHLLERLVSSITRHKGSRGPNNI